MGYTLYLHLDQIRSPPTLPHLDSSTPHLYVLPANFHSKAIRPLLQPQLASLGNKGHKVKHLLEPRHFAAFLLAPEVLKGRLVVLLDNRTNVDEARRLVAVVKWMTLEDDVDNLTIVAYNNAVGQVLGEGAAEVVSLLNARGGNQRYA